MDHLVVGVESTQESISALQFARLLSQAEGVQLHVVSVYSDSIFYEGVEEMKAARENYFEQMLEVADGELNGGFEFHRAIEASVPAGLTGVAEQVGADAMVIGSSHRGPIGRVFMGDAGARLAAGAPCVVIVTPRGWHPDEPPAIRKIGIAFDATPESDAALAYGSSLARTLKASVQLAGVIPAVRTPGRIAHTDRGYQQVLESDMQKLLDEATARTQLDDVEALVKTGNPADELVRMSIELDLLVLGSRGYGPVRRVLLGGTAVRVMRSSGCPVAVVPRPGE
ncbi:MAG: universal stress protein [Thermoleophilia bacterium]|nr:universal stress protein [Thermoleophilia bacterium]